VPEQVRVALQVSQFPRTPVDDRYRDHVAEDEVGLGKIRVAGDLGTGGDKISRPRASIPRNRGAPSKPQFSRWTSSRCIRSLSAFWGRRTVSPTRTTPGVCPPVSSISGSPASTESSSHRLAARPLDVVAAAAVGREVALTTHVGTQADGSSLDPYSHVRTLAQTGSQRQPLLSSQTIASPSPATPCTPWSELRQYSPGS